MISNDFFLASIGCGHEPASRIVCGRTNNVMESFIGAH